MTPAVRPLPQSFGFWLRESSLDELLALLDLVTDTLRARGVEVVIGFDDPK